MLDIERLIAADAPAWQGAVDQREPSESSEWIPASAGALTRNARQTRRKRNITIVLAAVVATAIPIGIYALVHTTSHSTPISISATVSGSPDSKVTTEPPEPLQFPPPTLLSIQRARSLTSVQWRLVAADSADATIRVYFYAGDGSCQTPAGLYVDETTTAVLVAALVMVDHSQQNCPARLFLAGSTITLKEPLGQRALLHAKVDSPYDKIPLP